MDAPQSLSMKPRAFYEQELLAPTEDGQGLQSTAGDLIVGAFSLLLDIRDLCFAIAIKNGVIAAKPGNGIWVPPNG